MEDLLDQDRRFDEIGRWWNRAGEEIDIVAAGKEEVIVGEVKCSTRPLDVPVLDALMEKAELIERLGGRPVRPIAFARTGFTERAKAWLREHHGLGFRLDDIAKISDLHVPHTPRSSKQATLELHPSRPAPRAQDRPRLTPEMGRGTRQLERRPSGSIREDRPSGRPPRGRDRNRRDGSGG